MTAKIISHVYEDSNPRPVLTHVFYGTTLKMAEAVERAHIRTDAVLRAAMTAQRFMGTPLFIERYKEEK